MKTFSLEHFNMLKNGRTIVIRGKLTPGKIYAFKFGKEKINGQCSSWFSAIGFLSSIVPL